MQVHNPVPVPSFLNKTLREIIGLLKINEVLPVIRKVPY
jgi:hypothetical protein